MKEYKIGEVFRHTDGKAYQCVEGETCEGCAFRCTGNDCVGPYCDGGSDGRPVKFIAVTEPVEGMLYRAKNGRMYRLAEGSHWDHWCACDDDPERSCAELDMAVFGGRKRGTNTSASQWTVSLIVSHSTGAKSIAKFRISATSSAPRKRPKRRSVCGSR